ncbi:hypothetical protein L1987_10983 [Smallanthus sonchifolius]|uniref:Uncharacterized protein n=1 Tax=Smallanthus sonchifolius TaxID=185202 RepID=A0ACB9J9N5_9ASTR|nr:hypothetical protein L1987_10983 [Smallanthus sonchifolius]
MFEDGTNSRRETEIAHKLRLIYSSHVLTTTVPHHPLAHCPGLLSHENHCPSFPFQEKEFSQSYTIFFLSLCLWGNPLDLNNFPDDLTKETLDESSSSASGIYRKKKNGSKDESGKVYECRFCSLKFCKSQALGGHMNRHRQERETEALNQARQLVFSNDNILPPLHHQLGGQAVVHGGFHHQAACNMGSTVYPTKLFPDITTTILPPVPPPQPTPRMYTYSSQRPPSHPVNDYFLGHVCSGNPPAFSLQSTLNRATTPPAENTNNYTCIGAPVGQSFTLAEGSGGGREMSQSPITRYHQHGF